MINFQRFLGCSGQNIDDICRHISNDDRIFMAEKTLEWRNLSPTSPDSLCNLMLDFELCSRFLDCYPFYEKDPFVLSECPHVYFIGNQPKFETKLIDSKNN